LGRKDKTGNSDVSSSTFQRRQDQEKQKSIKKSFRERGADAYRGTGALEKGENVFFLNWSQRLARRNGSCGTDGGGQNAALLAKATAPPKDVKSRRRKRGAKGRWPALQKKRARDGRAALDRPQAEKKRQANWGKIGGRGRSRISRRKEADLHRRSRKH